MALLVTAMNTYQVAKRQHKENVKNQHNQAKGSKGEKTYFRASEMGNGDRKIIYSFFGHRLPKVERGAKNLRQLENGDYVHERYQTAWEEMGILISKEVRLSSRNDEWLGQFPWEWAGHYDGELDVNIIRAFALGKARVDSFYDEEAKRWEVAIDIDDGYAEQVGLFLPGQPGVLNPEYQPLRMVADIKTINPYGFRDIKIKRDLTKIGGYIDQIMFYMYMLQTPYGSIYFESKANNDVVEVQILWEDFYDGTVLDFDESIHGKQHDEVVRAKVSWSRFTGDDTQEGCVPRLTRLWNIKEGLEQADEAGDMATISALMPERCDGVTDPKGFPCSWGHKDGAEHVQYCEYYDHCWSEQHSGLAVSAAPTPEAVPPEAIWSFEDDSGEVRIDNRKVPEGVGYEGFLQLVQMGVLDYKKFLVEEAPPVASLSARETAAAIEAEKTAMNGYKELFNLDGTLVIGKPELPTEAQEYIADNGDKAIVCTNCSKEVTYKRLGNGGTKKCGGCGHINKVKKL